MSLSVGSVHKIVFSLGMGVATLYALAALGAWGGMGGGIDGPLHLMLLVTIAGLPVSVMLFRDKALNKERFELIAGITLIAIYSLLMLGLLTAAGYWQS